MDIFHLYCMQLLCPGGPLPTARLYPDMPLYCWSDVGHITDSELPKTHPCICTCSDKAHSPMPPAPPSSLTLRVKGSGCAAYTSASR
jgi:hypothetical protein